MTPVPPAARHDPYRFIHKGLRAALLDTLLHLGGADPGDDAELQDALQRADELLALLLEHTRQENNFFHVAIEARQPGATRTLGEEHAAMQSTLADLREDVQHLRRTLPASRSAQLHWLYQRFGALAAEQLAHMAREEEQLNPLLWALYSDAELLAIHQRLLAASDATLLRTLVGWMTAALAPRELAGLFALVRRLAPPQEARLMLGAAQRQLGPARWLRLQALLAAPG